MENLWSTWRSKYIEGFKNPQENEECFICGAINDSQNDKERLVIGRFEKCIAIINRYPYNAGHLLIAPNRHIGDFKELLDDEMAEIFKVQQLLVKLIDKVMKPHGYNMGLNLGRHAGAGVPGHIHFHIVPRWNGDTNFMPILADIKIVSQSLEDLQEILADEIKNFKI